MKRWEVDRLAVVEGKKIKNKNWQIVGYLYWDRERGQYFDDRGNNGNVFFMAHRYGWEVYEEPKKVELPEKIEFYLGETSEGRNKFLQEMIFAIIDYLKEKENE